MIALGVDVGKRTGIALLDCAFPRPRRILSEAVDGEALAGRLAVLLADHDVAIVGIETPTQVFAHGRAREGMDARIGIERALLAAAPMIGVVRAVVELQRPAATVHEAQAHAVRRAVIGRLPRAGVDRHIANLLPHLVDGWPIRSNDHERDAAVVALWVSRRRAPLPVMPRMPARRRSR